MTTGSYPGEIILGIDFGTTYSSAAVLRGGRVEFVLDGAEKAIPSVVYIPEDHKPVVGAPAIRKGALDPSCAVYSIKRLLGRSVDSPEARQLDAGHGFCIKAGPNRMAILSLRGQDYAPVQIAGYIIERLRDIAVRRFGDRIRRAVMTVPSNASQAYRDALRQAASFANLEILRFVEEPVAGALALGKNMEPADRQLLICDFGGGTFDTSWTIQRGHDFGSLAVSGDPFLGGNDFDHNVAQAVAGHVFRYTGYEMQKDIVRWNELLRRCEMIKRRLSFVGSATLKMNDAFTKAGRQHDLALPVDRGVMERRWGALFERTEAVLSRLLELAGKTVDDVDEVLLIGGTSLIPSVRRLISRFFARKAECSPDADVVVTIGAAMLASAYM